MKKNSVSRNTEFLSEDQVSDKAREIIGLYDRKDADAGVGQLTTFMQLGITDSSDRPDGWYLPHNHANPALVVEVKSSKTKLGKKPVEELLKNIRIVQTKYEKVVGILYNGEDVRVFKGLDEIEAPDTLQNAEYYLSLFRIDVIDKERIYGLTKKINDCLHFQFGIKNLYHRMIFTACALVAERYDGHLIKLKDLGYAAFHTAIQSTLSKSLEKDRKQNSKIDILLEEYALVRMNITDNQKAINDFIDWVTEISDCINSDAWRGEDVMGIFFNEFNRYKKKTDAGQVFTPEHITDFMYHLLAVNKNDRVLDATAGSGGFLVKCMANMIREAGGPQTNEANRIKREQLFGIELDREIYALACANMLLHKDGKTNLEQMDARTGAAGEWIASKGITKVLMNPPYENKYGCMKIVENVLDNVPARTPCAFILPDKKLEKASDTLIARILKHHRLTAIIKLPEDLFFGVGITTSIFIFEAGVPQKDNEIFGCYIAEDGLQTVKNKGRHDVRNRWPDIEKYWLDSILKRTDEKYGTAQWLKPSEHLSYQMPEKPFELYEEDFRKTAMDYLMFKEEIDAKAFNESLLKNVVYSSKVSDENDAVGILLTKEINADERD